MTTKKTKPKAKAKTATKKKTKAKVKTPKAVMPETTHDVTNPDPWHALLLDNSTFIDMRAKQALMHNNASRSRQFFFPIIRPLARLSIVLVQLLRIVLPRAFTSSKMLHNLICWGMKTFVSKEANYLILRHFHIGSQILTFLNQNIADGALPAHPLHPNKIADLGNNTFVQHDLNIYNFVIAMNSYLQTNGLAIKTKALKEIDFSMITDPDKDLENLPERWTNVLDLQTAIEMYTPLFGVFFIR